MNRRDFCRALGFGAAALATPAWLTPARAQAAGRPNFVIVYIDDLGYGDTSTFGSKRNQTPHLTRMAAEGMKFTDFYAAPVCTASRASLMTGCYAKRVGVPGVLFPGQPIGLNPADKTVAEYLKPLGYATACVGKWHLGDQPEFLPTRRGFDRYFGIPYSNDMGPSKSKPQHPPTPLLRDETVIEAPVKQTTLVERYTDEAVKFIRDNKERPFFLYLPHTAVHDPWNPGPRFKGQSGSKEYGDWVQEVDWSLGEVLKTLRELGLAERTCVLFTSDNGGQEDRQTHLVSNAPLRGFKHSTWEGGMRVPTVAWWPGRIPAGRVCHEIASTMDVLPTFVALAGGQVSAQPKIDGGDLRPLLFGEAGAKSPHEAFFYFQSGVGELEAVRRGPWKYRLKEKALYNLEKDIGETTNVAAQNPDVVKRLMEWVNQMDQDLGVSRKGPGCRPPARVENPKPLLMKK